MAIKFEKHKTENKNSGVLENIENYLKSKVDALIALSNLKEKERIEKESVELINFTTEQISKYALLGDFETVIEIASISKKYLNQQIDIQNILKNYYEELKDSYIDIISNLRKDKKFLESLVNFINSLLTEKEERFNTDDAEKILQATINRLKSQISPNLDGAFWGAVNAVFGIKTGKNIQIVTITDSRDNVLKMFPMETKNPLSVIKAIKEGF